MSAAAGAPSSGAAVAVGDLSRALVEAAEAVRRTSADVAAELGLTSSQAALLWQLDPAGEPPAMRSLAATMCCDPSNVTLLGDALRRAGLVERRAHPADRRARVLVLTEAGRSLRQRLSSRLEETSPLGALSADERRALDTALRLVPRPQP